MSKKRIKQLLIALFLGIFIFSCSDNESYETNDINEKSESFISQNSAKTIAENLLFTNIYNSKNLISQKNPSPNSKKVIKRILNVPDDNNITAYYIINYEEGGFVILAGDKRSEPILAFSETNNFDLDTEYYPSGLVSWLYSSKENIQKLRKEKSAITTETNQKWKNLLKGNTDIISYREPPIDPEPDCTPYTIQKGPYTQTTWGQKCGYNSLTPAMTCGPCGHAYTGCVATAMAQIMKYHEYPSNFNWADMPNSGGTNSTAILMDDIGTAVGMNYTCESSGADTQNEVASSFRNDFNYTSASYADYNYQTVKNELNYGRPVILKGGRNTGWWIFGQYSDGHAWVCDGYLNYIDPCWGSILKYHMNWGWDGTYNGYYSFNNFNPGDYTFNYKTGMVYNIKP